MKIFLWYHPEGEDRAIVDIPDEMLKGKSQEEKEAIYEDCWKEWFINKQDSGWCELEKANLKKSEIKEIEEIDF